VLAVTQCWQCREPVQGPVCAGCGAIQPPPPHPELFAILGLSPSYTIDRKAVDRAWRGASRKVHPDRFAGASAVQRRMALQWTAHLNRARKVIRDDTQRAWYLATGSERPGEKDKNQPDPAFLEEVFELNMLRAEDPVAAIERARSLQSTEQERLSALFQSHEQGGTLDGAPAILGRLNYLRTVIDGGHE
jgi:molecular chaperone HscB